MKRLFILEHPRHLALLRKEAGTGDVFVALTPQAAHALEGAGLACRTPDYYFQHDEYWRLYPECTARVIAVTRRLDDILAGVDRRFPEQGVRPWALSLYIVKILSDVVSVYVFWLRRILLKEAATDVFVAAGPTGALGCNVDKAFGADDAVVAAVLEKLSRPFGFRLHRCSVPPERAALTERLRDVRSSEWIRQLRAFLQGAARRTARPHRRYQVLGVNCRDLAALREPLLREDISIIDFPSRQFETVGHRAAYAPLGALAAKVADDAALQDLCTFEGVRYFDLLRGPLLTFASELEVFLTRHHWTADYLARHPFDLVISKSLAPFEAQCIMTADICRKRDIPHATWMHGGFGGYRSFEGYDLTDLAFGDRFVSYGAAINRAIDRHFPGDSIGHANGRTLAALCHRGDMQLVVGGAPHMENEFRAYGRPANDRKVVVLILGELWHHNQYYMGGNTPYAHLQGRRDVQSILEALIPFQDTYEIVVKTYPGDRAGARMWREYLDAAGGTRVKVVRHEESMTQVLRRCDLAISLWVSTTFFEAAFTDCDQFMFDRGDLTDEMRDVLQSDCFFRDELSGFCGMLREYLLEGRFYRRPKSALRERYLDWANRDRRPEVARDLILALAQKRRSAAPLPPT